MNARALSWLAVAMLLGCGGESAPKDPGSRCGDGVVDPGEACDLGSGNSDAAPDGCRRDCTAARCGDGVADAGEACDEGEFNDDLLPGACRTACVLPTCGDGVIDDGEACDDGAENGLVEDACRPTCVPPACGDGIRDSGESCDEGPENADDLPGACRTTCALPSCGDGVRDDGEACDEGLENSDRLPGACRTTCALPACGDGVRDDGEACDDGDENGDTAPDACRSSCELPSCGDGVADAGEACDDGPGNDDLAPDACRTDCRAAGCGDGVLDAGESCDAGALASDELPDVCRTDCRRARCGDGVRDAGEGCDNGALNSDERGGACRTSCTVPRCGDGVTDPGEGCDDAEANDDAAPNACRSTCTPAGCGDRVVDDGEWCDDGNLDASDGCDDCLFAPPYCSVSNVVDLSGGAPWSGVELVFEGAIGPTSWNSGALGCNPGSFVDALHAIPIPFEGALVVEATGLSAGFVPAVELRGACRSGPLACAAAPSAGQAAVAVAAVQPADLYRWIAVEDASGTGGTYRLKVKVLAPLGAGAACLVSGVTGLCAATLACPDPDGNGAGTCAPRVALGGACDPLGQASVCVDSACRCPVEGCAIGACTSTCGDAVVQTWEECDDGDVTAADNCTPTCRFAGRTCAEPYRMNLVPVAGGFEWAGTSAIGSPTFTASCGVTGTSPDVIGAFTAPVAGDWAFRLTPGTPSWPSALSIGTGACGSGAELACAWATSNGSTPTVRVPLAAGETVWPIVDGTGNYARSGPFTLRAERVLCGDGVVGISEECDDGNTASGDNCSPSCVAAGRDCAFPWTLGWDAVAREAVWSSALSLATPHFTSGCAGSASAPDLVARFVAPFAGEFSFELKGGTFAPVLALRQGTSCGASAELACSYYAQTGNTRNLVRRLAVGEEVWVVVDAPYAISSGGEFTLKVRPVACGDGVRALPEECDDGNVVAGDGCSATCALEAAETEPNDTLATSDPVALGGPIRAAITPATEEDWFSFAAVGGTTYTLKVFAGQVGNCTLPTGTGSADARLSLVAGDGTELAYNDDVAGWYCPQLVWTAPADGTYHARVRNVRTQPIPRYFLDVR